MKNIFNYIVPAGMALFLIGVVMAFSTGCNGRWESCWEGSSRIGVIIATTGVAIVVLTLFGSIIIGSFKNRKR